MKAILVLCLCIVAVESWGSKPKRPDFDCDKWCKREGYKPVCSTGRKAFQNDCYLECNWHYKECDGGCPCRPSRPDRPDRPDKPNRSYTPSRPDRPDWSYTPSRPDRPDWSYTPSRPERPSRPDTQYIPYRPEPPVQVKYCTCDYKYDPVCTTDGTEDSKCVAECRGKWVLYDGICID